ncbi:bifunctional 3-(3-hydroxy-phenyl)propionate/3-hydroxycinnamic acid hydroxylase [Nonomuraea guangzhouensis]|uniref:Bifunctional 3-(3-hydroxy-phenyl)propionate/3-hydroxycinnamic acid hydroxylase n=1 Tax=Nonomuraea guangzhouensis TaxID=1291555 RepID=A0ABW4G8N3_9ACTN|nr:bifunctional 3-(3-hydroxy-phenyl)propionate/3-hydroxycinnamic acid hydroxylase [Nonomuraea guangzhouensis]
MTPTLRTQVAVVGAGPAGATLANFLGMYGVDALLIERSPEIIDYPRAVGMDDESLRSFQAVGLADELIKNMIQNVPLRFFDARNQCFADVRPATREYGWSRRNIFMQPTCEETLRRGLDRFPSVRVLLGHEVVRLEQDGDGVELHVHASGDETLRVRAEYVVGADGGRSTVRELLGVELEGDTHPHKWVVVECDNDPLEAQYTGLHCDPARPYVCVHLPHDFRRWEFMLFPGEDADEMLKTDKVHELLGHHVEDPTRLNIIRARVYTHHSRIARRFTVGRVCLVGDAAHLMPPWAGQGMNTGIRDVTNVAWKIAAAVRQHADPGILATYDTERRPHAQAMIDLSTTLGRILSPTNRLVATARDLFFRAVVRAPVMRDWVLQMRFKPMPQYTDGVVVPDGHGRRSPVGRMFIQPLVENAEGDVLRLDDVLGPWFALVGFGADPAEHLSGAQRDYLIPLGATFVKVVDSRAGLARRATVHPRTQVVEDLEGHLREWFTRHSTRFVVIRPDRYVAATADRAGLGQAVDRLRRLLRPPGTGTEKEES